MAKKQNKECPTCKGAGCMDCNYTGLKGNRRDAIYRLTAPEENLCIPGRGFNAASSIGVNDED